MPKYEEWHVMSSAEKAFGRTDRGIIIPPSARFAGDLGPNKLYHGTSLNLGDTTISAFEASCGTNLGLYRRYYANRSMADISPFTADLATDLASDRLTWASFKLPGASTTGWLETVNGQNDAWLQAIADAITAMAPHPVWIAFHHEPRNDGPAADFRAMYAYICPFIHATCSNVAVGPILNGFSFATGGDIDPTIWLTPDADMINFDQYNQWWTYQNPISENYQHKPDSYHPFNTVATVMKPLDVIAEQWGFPCAIAEWGVHHPWLNSPNSPVIGDDVTFMQGMFQYAIDRGAAALTYFNSGLNSPRGFWDMNKYLKPDSSFDLTEYTDTSRLTQFALNGARPECGFPSQRLT